MRPVRARARFGGVARVGLVVLSLAVSGVAPTAQPRPGLAAASVPEQGDATAGRAAVFTGDAPDPDLLRVGDEWFVFTTNRFSLGWTNVPVRRSADLTTWTSVGDALPTLGRWAEVGKTWAPAVERLGGRWVLYYTATHRASGRQCIGRAISDEPAGPYVDHWSTPLVCEVAAGGSIDPETYVDASGQAWLLWKNDGNCCGLTVRLWSRRLTEDGFGLTGPSSRMVTYDRGWEAPLVEQPALVRDGSAHWFTYSARWWESSGYASGYATCSGPAGPCTKRSTSGPWHATTPHARGPGGISFALDANGGPWMAHHGWVGAVGYAAGGTRALFVDAVSFDGAPAPEPSVPYGVAARQPLAGSARAVVLDGDGDGHDEVLWYVPGTTPERWWEARGDRTWTAQSSLRVDGSYRPVAGDFDGDGFEDLLWYGPGAEVVDHLWEGRAVGTFVGRQVRVVGRDYQPVAGDFDGDGFDDVLWYGPGGAADFLWWGQRNGFSSQRLAVRGTYEAAVGDLDGDGVDDVLWYGEGDDPDFVWWGRAGRGFTSQRLVAGAAHGPVVGDVDGDGVDDVVWAGPTAGRSLVWVGGDDRAFTGVGLALARAGRPVGGDLDGDGRLDLLWADGSGAAPLAAYGGGGVGFVTGPPVLP